jgi:hypothetical protein
MIDLSDYFFFKHVNGKVMIPGEPTPGMGGTKDKGEWRRRWIQIWYIWCILRTFISATMYPHWAGQ